MDAALRELSESASGQNHSSNSNNSSSAFYRYFYGVGYEAQLAEAALVLAPRGYGRNSFRSAELVQLGLAQVWLQGAPLL
jgi:hypothetical protein